MSYTQLSRRSSLLSRSSEFGALGGDEWCVTVHIHDLRPELAIGGHGCDGHPSLNASNHATKRRGSNSLGLDAGSFTAWGSTPSLPPRRGLPSLGGGLGAYGSAPHAARGARRGALGWLHWKLAVALVAALLMSERLNLSAHARTDAGASPARYVAFRPGPPAVRPARARARARGSVW